MIKVNGMMAPLPYPGEHINSVIARLSWSLGYDNRTFYHEVLEIAGSHDRNLAQSLFADKVDNKGELLERSIVPYALPVYTQNEGNKMVDDILNSDFFTPNSKKLTNKSFTYCPLCFREQTERFGIHYFLTDHQIAGVNVCFKHGCYLHQTGTNDFGKLRTIPPGEPVFASPEEYAYLTGYKKLVGLTREQLDWAVFEAWEKEGLLDKRGRLIRNKLINLAKKKLKIDPGILFNNHLGSNIINQTNLITFRTYLALIHVLELDLIKAKERKPEDCPIPGGGKKSPKRKEYEETVSCMNPFCSGEAVRTGFDNRSAIYRCPECNTVFSSKRRILQTGKTLESGLFERHKTMGIREISRETGLSYWFIRRILNGPSSVDDIDKRISQIVDSLKVSPEYATAFSSKHKDAVFLKKYDRNLYHELLDKKSSKKAPIVTRGIIDYYELTAENLPIIEFLTGFPQKKAFDL